MAVRWLAWLSELDTPPQPCELTSSSSHRTAEVLSRSSTRSLRSLSRYFSASLDCEVRVLSDQHHLLSLDFHRCADDGTFVLRLGLQQTSTLPSLLGLTGPLQFDIDHRLLDLIHVTLFLDIIAFIRVVKLLGRKRGTGTATICSTVLFCACSCWMNSNVLSSSLNNLMLPRLSTTSSALSLCRSSHSDAWAGCATLQLASQTHHLPKDCSLLWNVLTPSPQRQLPNSSA